ncbi:uncharacterized protein TNCV_3620751 [Trichonephila clavipes]|nr:uncharacterized protein TNCV_3620751 [Trichonephila clavipes]
MDEQLKDLLEGINALKNGQEETRQEIQKGKVEIQKDLEETNQEMKKGQQGMEKGVENVQKWPVKLSTYDGKANCEVYNTQLSIISEVNGWTEGVKAYQLAASIRGEAAEILQTLPDTERPNLKPLYNALNLRFGKKYSKDYTRLQKKTRHKKTGESLQEYASEGERLINLAFSDHPATVQEVISLQYFVDGLKDEEIQKAVRIADVQDFKYVLVYPLKVEAANEATCRDSHSI